MSYIERIAEAQGFRCFYCEHLMYRYKKQPLPPDTLTKDHYIPRSEGGVTHPDNMVAACSQCNNLRGDVSIEVFYNLQQKWFKKNPYLWIRWHRLTRHELYDLKLQCLRVHERRLRGKARRNILYAYRHVDFSLREERLLARTPA